MNFKQRLVWAAYACVYYYYIYYYYLSMWYEVHSYKTHTHTTHTHLSRRNSWENWTELLKLDQFKDVRSFKTEFKKEWVKFKDICLVAACTYNYYTPSVCVCLCVCVWRIYCYLSYYCNRFVRAFVYAYSTYTHIRTYSCLANKL